MLSQASVTTMLPVKDLDRARTFYEGCLGLKPEDYRTMTDVVRGLGTPVVSALEGGYDLEGLGLCAEQHVLGLL